MLAQVRFHVIWNDPHRGFHFSAYMPGTGSLQQHFRKPLYRGPILHFRRCYCVHSHQVHPSLRCSHDMHNPIGTGMDACVGIRFTHEVIWERVKRGSTIEAGRHSHRTLCSSVGLLELKGTLICSTLHTLLLLPSVQLSGLAGLKSPHDEGLDSPISQRSSKTLSAWECCTQLPLCPKGTFASSEG